MGCYPGVFPGVYPGVSGPSPGLSGFSGPLRDCPLRASPGLSGAASGPERARWTQTKVSYILYKTNWGYPTTHNTLHTPHIGPYQAPFGASMPSGWFCMYRGYPKCHVSLPGTALSGPLRVFRVSPGLPSPGLSGPSPGLSGSQGAIRAPGETRRDPESTPPLRASRIRRWLSGSFLFTPPPACFSISPALHHFLCITGLVWRMMFRYHVTLLLEQRSMTGITAWLGWRGPAGLP